MPDEVSDLTLVRSTASTIVMAGLVPAIHDFLLNYDQDVDARDERGHDGWM
jgi:hypothetical protein